MIAQNLTCSIKTINTNPMMINKLLSKNRAYFSYCSGLVLFNFAFMSRSFSCKCGINPKKHVDKKTPHEKQVNMDNKFEDEPNLNQSTLIRYSRTTLYKTLTISMYARLFVEIRYMERLTRQLKQVRKSTWTPRAKSYLKTSH